jgi:hypothetical protein
LEVLEAALLLLLPLPLLRRSTLPGAGMRRGCWLRCPA